MYGKSKSIILIFTVDNGLGYSLDSVGIFREQIVL